MPQSLENQLAKLSRQEQCELLAYLEDYSKVPVTIDEFIDNEYYAGKILGGDRVYPYWREWLRKIYPNQFYSPYIEVCVTGAIGIGKSTVALIAVAYDIYRLTLIKNPHEKWHLIETTAIVIALMTANLSLAGTVLGSQLADLIEVSPYFQSIYAPKQGMLFPHKIGVVTGSRFGHALGMAVISAIIDEANFQHSVANQALDNYNNIKRRMSSRFMGENGSLPFRLWILSSKNEDSDFLENHIQQVRLEKGTLVIEAAIWEVQACKGIYSGKTFKVFIGDENRDPFIIDEAVGIPSYIDDSRIKDVPIEYRGEFEKDLQGSLRDLAGVSSRSSLQLFKEMHSVDAAMLLDSYFTAEIIEMGEDSEDSIQDYLKPSFREIANKSQQRFVHIDTALKGDRLGLACTYPVSSKAISRVDYKTGEVKSFEEHVFMCEWAVAIKAKPGSEIPFYKIREFITYLRNDLGFNIARVSTDGFQSADTRQLLRKQNFETDYISVDRTKDPYRSAKRAIIESRLILPKSKLLRFEFKHLVDTGKKIDHPDEVVDENGKRIPGSKDLSDAVVGSYFNAAEHSYSNQLYADTLINQMREDNAQVSIFGMNPKEMLSKGLASFMRNG